MKKQTNGWYPVQIAGPFAAAYSNPWGRDGWGGKYATDLGSVWWHPDFDDARNDLPGMTLPDGPFCFA